MEKHVPAGRVGAQVAQSLAKEGELPPKPSYRVRVTQGKMFPCYSDISEMAVSLDAGDLPRARAYLDLLIAHMEANGYTYEAQMLRWRLSHQEDPNAVSIHLAQAPVDAITE